MAATFDVKLDRGGTDGTPGNKDTITNLRMRTDDANTADTTNPIPIVSGQTKYSFWRHVYLKCTGAPASYCNNFKFYTDGSVWANPTGVTCYSCDDALTNTNAADTDYEVADGTVGDTGTEMTAGHSQCTARTDIDSYTSPGSEQSIGVSEGSSQIDAVDEETDYLLLQTEVQDTASPGTLTAETVTWQYDEV